MVIIKLLFKTICIGVIAAGGYAYFSWTQGKDPTASLRALNISMPQVSLPAAPTLPEIPKISFGKSKPKPATFYRWNDASGGTHFSTTPPPAGTVFESVKIDPNANVIEAHKSAPVTDTSREPSYTGARNDNSKIQLQADQIKKLNADRIDNLDTLISQQQ